MKRRLTRNAILMAIVTLIMGIGLSLYIASTGTVPAADNAASYTDGTYTASAHGCLSDVAVTVTITGNDGSNVTVLTERVQTNEMDVTATRSTMDMWGIIFSAVIPVAILACGLVIFLKRRHL